MSRTSNIRRPPGVNVHNYRVREGNITVDLSFVDPDALTDRLIDLLIEELTPVFNKMENMAKRLCPVGHIIREGNGPTHRRRPGTLRNSIKKTVAKRHDRTAVLGFLEAGDDDAFYAVFVEFGPVTGARSWTWTPYLRPAFNAHVGEARQAVSNALRRLTEG